ncbi:protein of unknown function [Chryseobacterium sp. JV274]|nr:protein of unknown function [Chryseobacterium sp. JV274]
MALIKYSMKIHEISNENINIFVKLQNDYKLHVRNYKLNKNG